MRRSFAGLALLAVLATVGGLGCSSIDASYNCGAPGADVGQCNEGPAGVCVSKGGENYCAYPDPECGSGYYSFGTSAGSNAGQCIPPNNMSQPIDAGIDGPVDAYFADAASTDVCFGEGSAWCISTVTATTPLTFDNVDIFSHGDSQHASACTGSATVFGTSFCVVGASDITFSGQITLDDVAGSFPIAFVSAGTITIDGAINAGSQKGRAFDPPGMTLDTACSKINGSSTFGGAAGGGAGGTYGTAGGNGGNSNGGQAAAPGANIATAILGGCAGGTGGQSGVVIGGTNAPAGSPGGVIYLVAKGGITIASGGDINVSGGGGKGADQPSAGGGGGGGTGGFVAFDTPTLMVNGPVLADGGGGGGGASQTHDFEFTTGGDGDDGGASVASGGEGGGNGGAGNGGAGAFGNGQHGVNGQGGGNNTGGGGGGGGVGVIWLVGTPGPAVNFSDGASFVGQLIEHP